MAGNRSGQETNILREVNKFINASNGPITIKGKNRFEIRNVINLTEDPLGDRSAADLIAITSDGNHKISCKKDNPINFAGSGLKSFVDDYQMRSWMNKVLGEVAAKLNSYLMSHKTQMMNRIGNYLIEDIKRNPINSPIDKTTENKIISEYDNFSSLTIPDIYIKIPDSMRNEIFTATNNGGPIRYYILNGPANSFDSDTKTNTITINDCDILSTDKMVKSGETIYLLIRKRRADQFFQLKDKGNVVKNRDGFLRIFSKSLSKSDIGARIQIREKEQLPEKLKTAIIQGTKTKLTSAPPSSIILEID
jgi:hypothetical protein